MSTARPTPMGAVMPSARSVIICRPMSTSDAITNSSTELFAVNGFGTAADVLAIVDDLWEEYLLDFPDDPDLKWVRGTPAAEAFMPNDEYLARNQEWHSPEYGAAMRPGVVVLSLPVNTPDGFVEKVGRTLAAPNERAG